MSNLWVLPEDLSAAQQESDFAEEACEAASEILRALSGRKINGVTTVTERYVRDYPVNVGMGNSKYNTEPVLVNGEVANVGSVVYEWVSPEARLKLRGNPVQEVLQVLTAQGDVIPSSDYYLVDHSTIQFLGGAVWATYNLQVSYRYGRRAPMAGALAARQLAQEFVLAWEGDDDCALPQRVTSVQRQGVSYTILDSQDFIDDLRTGLIYVDMFLKSVNPDKARNRARVFSPDVPRARRRVS